MVLEVGVEPRAAVLVGAQEPTVGVPQVAEDELGARDRRLDVVRAAQHGAGVGQRGDGERVPGGQPLVVEAGADAALARLPQAPADLRARRGLGSAGLEDVGPLEIPALGGSEVGDRLVREVTELGAELVERPHVVATLDALGVGVQRAGESTLGAAQLAQDEVQRLLAGAAQDRVAADLEPVQVGAGEQRVVVEHLLEVGHGPRGIDGVPGEPAAHLVVDASGGHRLQRVQRHLRLPAPQQQVDDGGGRELRRITPAAVDRVVAAAQVAHGGGESAAVDRLGRGRQTRATGQLRHDPPASGADLVPPVLPGVGDRLEDHVPAREAPALLRREVRPSVEGHLVGGDERVEGPATVSRHGLHGVHVDRVDVGALLAIHLDAHEVAVHVRGDLGVLEGLALHDVAPVAGGVADAEQDRLVFRLRAPEGFLPPRMPVHRVVGVLEEVGAGGLDQPVRVLGDGGGLGHGGLRGVRSGERRVKQRVTFSLS